jgi:2-polyprenyl-6-hydroxyphenyl methylase/3-demethylubiquinone-9 3-methyltransferase
VRASSKSGRGLISRPVAGQRDVRDFFDQAAAEYQDCHGPAAALLTYRLEILKRMLPPTCGVLAEVGCGTAMHLHGLADRFDRGIGLDLSPAMIDRCKRERQSHPEGHRIQFAVDAAEQLATLTDAAVDAVIGVGVYEHVLDRPAALAEVFRVLKPGGVFACLTPNGAYLWYTQIATSLGLETRHLSTDRFLTESEWKSQLNTTGFDRISVQPWTFIPRGDMPPVCSRILAWLDKLAQPLGCNRLRGGLAIRAVKPGPR